MDRAIADSTAFGTALVGDISNTLVSFNAAHAQSRSPRVVFFEVLGFNVTRWPDAFVAHARREIDALGSTDRVRASLAAHAPHYGRAARVSRDPPRRSIAIHSRRAACTLSESVEEVEFIRTGGGPWRRLLEEGGFWNAGMDRAGRQPGAVSRRQRLSRCARARRSWRADDASRSCRVSPRAARRSSPARGATATRARGRRRSRTSTPRASAWPSGTDSLASAPDLSVFAELATLRALAPSVPASALLASATVEGARALGFDADYGTIEPGKRARLVAVDIPAGAGDVEEYLVSGSPPGPDPVDRRVNCRLQNSDCRLIDSLNLQSNLKSAI